MKLEDAEGEEDEKESSGRMHKEQIGQHSFGCFRSDSEASISMKKTCLAVTKTKRRIKTHIRKDETEGFDPP